MTGPSEQRPPERRPSEGEGLVWLVDGDERPFEPLPDLRRPWLEESSSWGSPREDAPAEDPVPDTLVWL